MTYDGHKRQFDRDGFVVVPQFMVEQEFEELAGNLDRYISTVVPTLPATAAFYQDPNRPETLKQLQFMDRDPYFRQMMTNPRWLELAQALLGEPVVCQGGPEWFNKPPSSEHATPPHQDNYYFNLKPPQVLTIWVAIDPVDADNGCLQYLPGSHKQGRRPHEQSQVLGFSKTVGDWKTEDEARMAKIELQAGDAVVHHGELIHQADPNRSSSRHRRAFAQVIKGLSAKVDEVALAAHSESARSQMAKHGVTS